MGNKEENVKRSCFTKQYECLIISYHQDYRNPLFQLDHDLIIIQRFIQIPYWLVRDIWRFEEVCIKIITFGSCQRYSHWIKCSFVCRRKFFSMTCRWFHNNLFGSPLLTLIAISVCNLWELNWKIRSTIFLGEF